MNSVLANRAEPRRKRVHRLWPNPYRSTSMVAAIVVVESPEYQSFNGRRYRKYPGRRYYTSHRWSLHRDVWTYFNGPIPDGYCVHHIDHNTDNNQIENLTAMCRSKHASYHGRLCTRTPVEAIAAQEVWRNTPEGKAFLKEMGRRNTHYMHQLHDFVCEQCGAEYRTQSQGRNRFCSLKCKAKHRRESGVDNESRTCSECGKGFTANKYDKKHTCSIKCRTKVVMRNRAEKWNAHYEKKRKEAKR